MNQRERFLFMELTILQLDTMWFLLICKIFIINSRYGPGTAFDHEGK